MANALYRWVHPSWRDLLIEHLQTHPSERREFLKKASQHGLELAISGSGGASGTRSFPLIQDEDDWKLFGGGIERAIAEDDGSQVLSILLMLRDALNRLQNDEQKLRQCLVQLKRALVCCREKWDQSGFSISRSLLKVYYDLSTAVEPLPPGPNLEATWSTHIETVNVALKEWGNELSGLQQPFDEMAELCELLSHNEPRFLRKVCHVNVLESPLKHFFSVASNEIDEETQLDTELRLRERIEFLEGISHALKNLSGSVSAKPEHLLTLSKEYFDKATALQSRYDEKYAREEVDYEPEEQDQSFDIFSIFNDL